MLKPDHLPASANVSRSYAAQAGKVLTVFSSSLRRLLGEGCFTRGMKASCAVTSYTFHIKR